MWPWEVLDRLYSRPATPPEGKKDKTKRPIMARGRLPAMFAVVAFVLLAVAEGRLRGGAAEMKEKKTYATIKALADEYGVPCAPRAADLKAAVKEIKARNAERSAAVEVQKDFEEERAQSRFTNATLELETAAKAARAAANQKLENATDTAQAALADTLRQLRESVDARTAERDAAAAALKAKHKSWHDAEGIHETALDVASNNRKAANDTRTAEIAALAIMQQSAAEDAESSYVWV